MFYRYTPENITKYFNDAENAANPDSLFNYADIFDDQIDDEIKEQLKDEKGFFIKPFSSFYKYLKKQQR
ncbi:hypothetical protein ACWXVM_01960 [Mycoplasma sp. 2261]